jgi:polyribonucleotide nucleotidyltransferase
MKEVSEAEMLEAIAAAHAAIKVQIDAQEALAAQVPGAFPKRTYNHETNNEDLRKAVADFCYDQVYAVATSGTDKSTRREGFKAVKEAFLATLSDEDRAAQEKLVGKYFGDVEYDAMRNMILNEGKRLDGRSTTDIRPIWAEVDYLPGAHGSALFTRGETQSLTTITLGSKLDENKIDQATFVGARRFYLHYNFPPFSTGEVKRMMGVSRREIGHGNLPQRKPLRHPRSERHPGIQWFVFHGYRLCCHPRFDGRWYPHYQARIRHCHGFDHQGQQVCHLV